MIALPSKFKTAAGDLLALFRRQQEVSEPRISYKFTEEQLGQFREFFKLLDNGWEVVEQHDEIVVMRKYRGRGIAWSKERIHVPMIFVNTDEPRSPVKPLQILFCNGYRFAIDLKSSRVLVIRDYRVVCKISPTNDMWISLEEREAADNLINPQD